MSYLNGESEMTDKVSFFFLIKRIFLPFKSFHSDLGFDQILVELGKLKLRMTVLDGQNNDIAGSHIDSESSNREKDKYAKSSSLEIGGQDG